MDSIKFDKKNCKMIAHRGLSGVKFENTCEAFYAAASRSYYGVEADIHVTSDKKFAILHDNDTSRIGNVKLTVSENTLEDLQKKVTLYDEGNNRLTGTIPSLADYINICKEYGKKAFLDLKNRYDPADIDKIIDEIINLGYIENTVFASFHFDNLQVVKGRLPNQKIQFLTPFVNEAILNNLEGYHFDLSVRYYGSGFTKEVIDRLHKAGLEVCCWTVNDPKAALDLIDMGVDYLSTNILE